MKYLTEKKDPIKIKKWYTSTVTALHGQFKQVVINIDDNVYVCGEGDKTLVFDGRNIAFFTDKSTARKSLTKPEKLSKEESKKIENKYGNII